MEKTLVSKLAVAAGLLAAFAAPEHVSKIFLQSLSDAYLDVTVFVAATIIPIHFLGHKMNLGKFEALLQKKYFRIPVAALLGASPGCGGAIVVTAAFAKGKLCFASVVAVLTATMGDAAFLLLSKSPSTAVLMMAIGTFVGTVSGWVVSLIHKENYLRPTPPVISQNEKLETDHKEAVRVPPERIFTRSVWWSFFTLACIVTVTPSSFFSFIGLSIDELILPLGALGAIACILNWFLEPADNGCAKLGSVQSAINTTNRVTIWVIVAFAIYEILAMHTPVTLQETFAITGPLTPIIGTLIGFVPSCGPQISYTELFLRGIVDLPGLVANGISNDGDALFPMLAIAPRAAILSFFYTAIPATTTGYALYWFLT